MALGAGSFLTVLFWNDLKFEVLREKNPNGQLGGFLLLVSKGFLTVP